MGHRVAGILPCVVLMGGWLVWFTLPGQAAEGDISGTIASSHGPEAGVWATYGEAATWHIEGGKGVRPGIVKFQVRPNPLAN